MKNVVAVPLLGAFILGALTWTAWQLPGESAQQRLLRSEHKWGATTANLDSHFKVYVTVQDASVLGPMLFAMFFFWAVTCMRGLIQATGLDSEAATRMRKQMRGSWQQEGFLRTSTLFIGALIFFSDRIEDRVYRGDNMEKMCQKAPRHNQQCSFLRQESLGVVVTPLLGGAKCFGEEYLEMGGLWNSEVWNCGIALDDPPNFVHPQNPVDSAQIKTADDNDIAHAQNRSNTDDDAVFCVYFCTEWKPFLFMDILKDIGSLLGGAVFLSFFVSLMAGLSFPNIKPGSSTLSADVDQAFAMSLPMKALRSFPFFLVCAGLFMMTAGGYSDLPGALTDKSITCAVMVATMQAWAIRFSAVFTENMWSNGFDTFPQLSSDKKRIVTSFEWVAMPADQRRMFMNAYVKAQLDEEHAQE